jgi:ankyrin repeat protein
VIQFSHFSVKEYLISSRLAEANDIISRRYHVSLKRAHTLVAQACLGILLHMNNGITRQGLRKYPLAEYAAEHWIDHALFEGVSENAEDGMKELFDPRKPHFGIWLWIHDPTVTMTTGRQTERPVRPLAPQGTPLHCAAYLGLQAIVKFLVVERSQDVHSDRFEIGLSPLHVAAHRGHVGVTRTLLECGANVVAQDASGSTPLQHASFNEHVELARILLEWGADAAHRNDNGSGPLLVASSKGNMELVRMLLEWGADPSAQDRDMQAPLHWASRLGHVELARLLLDRGADPLSLTEYGQTSLHLASSGGHVELIRLFLEFGADVTARDDKGETPLHRVAYWGHVEAARVLLEYGADPTAWKPQFFGGGTPLDMASRRGHVELAHVLREAAEVRHQ